MALAVFAIAFGFALTAADLLFLLMNYIIHFNGREGKNGWVLVLAIILVISSVITLAGGMSLSSVLTSLKQPDLSAEQIKQLLSWARNLKVSICITSVIQVISAVPIPLLYQKMQKEKKEALSNNSSKWDWGKIRG